MDQNFYEGNWNTLKGKIKEKWGKFTDDDLTEIEGNREQILGHLQNRYGYDEERAEQELSNWEKEIEPHFRTRSQGRY